MFWKYCKINRISSPSSPSLCSTLSQVIHAVAVLLYPFIWQHTLISIIPEILIDVVMAPTPYLLGVQKRLADQVTDQTEVSAFNETLQTVWNTEISILIKFTNFLIGAYCWLVRRQKGDVYQVCKFGHPVHVMKSFCERLFWNLSIEVGMYLHTGGRWGHNITSQTQRGNQTGPQGQKRQIK